MNEEHQARILLALVRGHWDAAEELTRQEPIDPAGFVSLAREADIHAGLHAMLEREGRSGLPGDEVMARLEPLRSKVGKDNMLLLARAEQSLDLLRDAGVTPLALKGLDLLHRVYDRFDERTLDDVDLLVRAGELRRALEALEAAGWQCPPEPKRTHYIRSSHHLPLRSPGPVTVDFELHWNLVQDDRFRVDPEGIFERGLPLEVAGRTVLRMEDHDLVAHLLVHHFTHYFDRRLKWLVDLQRICALPGFRWSRVIERVRSWGATAVSGASLLHLHRLSPDLIPEEALRGLPLSAWRRALALPLRSAHPLELYRGARRRPVQLYLAAVLLEKPHRLPAWLLHRRRRDRRRGDNPLDRNDYDSGARARKENP
jgi:hypothetical protein